MDTYLQQAENFLKETNTTLSIEFVKYGTYFNDDKERRNIYKFTFKRGKKRFSGTFGDSINNTTKKIKPNSYDILACLTKYDPESFENFCSEYGYDNDKISHKKIYNAVAKEFINVCKIWNDEEIENLREIN